MAHATCTASRIYNVSMFAVPGGCVAVFGYGQGNCAFRFRPPQACQFCTRHHPSVLMQLGLTVISNLAATAEGAALLLRSPLLCKTEQQLHHLLQRREGPRTAALLRPLVSLAVHAEGQKQILRAAAAPGQLPHHLSWVAHAAVWCLTTSCSASMSC